MKSKSNLREIELEWKEIQTSIRHFDSQLHMTTNIGFTTFLGILTIIFGAMGINEFAIASSLSILGFFVTGFFGYLCRKSGAYLRILAKRADELETKIGMEMTKLIRAEAEKKPKNLEDRIFQPLIMKWVKWIFIIIAIVNILNIWLM